ncbi:hypothetical protein EUTSA_v10002248mg, partial [Eutrema salsugineum]
KKDGGFWINLLESNAGITLKMIKDVHIKTANKWSREDRLRLVYVCVIVGLVMAKSIYIHIPHKYIMLVMDLERLHRYPWGLKARLREGKSYTLDGFSLPLQIWIMEAIPVLGTMMSTRVKDEPVTIPRCTNWLGFNLTFRKVDDIYPFISCTGDFDIIDSAEYVRDDEMTDGRVYYLKDMIGQGKDWSKHVWEIDGAGSTSSSARAEPSATNGDNACEECLLEAETPSCVAGDVSIPNRSKKRVRDPGSETRKKQMLWERAVTKERHIDDGLESFIRDLFQSALKPLEEKIHNLHVMGKLSAPSINATRSEEPSTSALPTNPVTVPLPKTAIKNDGPLADLHDVQLTQLSNIDLGLCTQEFLEKASSHLSQDSFVTGFDLTPASQRLEHKPPVPTVKKLLPSRRKKIKNTHICK